MEDVGEYLDKMRVVEEEEGDAGGVTGGRGQAGAEEGQEVLHRAPNTHLGLAGRDHK